MRARSTSDIPIQVLREFGADLGPEFTLEVDERQIFLRSAEPPSWITFLAGADWWVKALAAYSALYVAKLVEEAAKDTWKNRGKAISATVAVANKVKQLAIAIGNLRKRLPSRTRIELALPEPDDYFCTRVELLGTEPAEFEIQIALFVHYLPALVELMRTEPLDRRHIAGGVQLTLLPDGSLEVRWQDNDALEFHTRVLRPTKG